jgi:hypothetical protein
MQDEYNLYRTSRVPLENTQILLEAFPDAIDNKEVTPDDIVKWFAMSV